VSERALANVELNEWDREAEHREQCSEYTVKRCKGAPGRRPAGLHRHNDILLSRRIDRPDLPHTPEVPERPSCSDRTDGRGQREQHGAAEDGEPGPGEGTLPGRGVGVRAAREKGDRMSIGRLGGITTTKAGKRIRTCRARDQGRPRTGRTRSRSTS
jgi:hypothetical protein